MKKEFIFDNYSVVVTNFGITYEKNGVKYPINSEFRNSYDESNGIIIIENMYMRLNCAYPHERNAMFDFIARGFQIPVF